ncbi:MAG: hypothetical protein IKA72_00580 [Clostridia bacterium]|nr:hypothetical protein [Clostridia bacterium]
MNKNSQQQAQRQDFRYKFTTKLLLLCVLVLLLCLAGIAVSIYRMIANGGILTFYDFLKYPFLILICLFCMVLIIALLIKSQYTLMGTQLITQFGFIKSKYDVLKITALTHDREISKLQVNFGEEFFILLLDPAWADDFVHELIKLNPDADYTYTLTSAPSSKDEK